MHFIDLAGSENSKTSGATGLRFDEAKKINLSLTQLGRVILQLVAVTKNEDKKASGIDFRSSKLTHYLKDSLSGKTKTLMVANVSPDFINF